MNELKFEPWQGLYLSFYNKEFYREVLDKWSGFGFKFLALENFVQLVLNAVILFLIIKLLFQSTFFVIIDKLPEFEFNNGVCQISNSYKSDFKIGNQPLLYLNPNSDEYDNKVAAVLQVSPHYYIFQDDTKAIKKVSFPNYIKNFNKPNLKNILNIVNFLPLIIISIFPFYFLGNVCSTLFLGFVFMLFLRLAKSDLTFQQIMRSIIIANVPFSILQPILIPVSVLFHLSMSFFYYGLLLFYFISIVKSPKLLRQTL